MEKTYILKKENLGSWLLAMAKDADVFVPAEDRENSIINFFNLSSIETELGWDQEQDKLYSLNLEEKTRLSPKQIIYPQSEDLLDFSYQKNMDQLDDVEISIAPSKTDGKQIIFGLKPCDVQGIARLDAVFEEGVVKDSYYMDRRNNTTLIARGCNTVYEDCFCTMVGGTPYNFENADIGMYELDDDYVVNVFTEKGQQLADKYGDFLKPPSNDADYYSKALDDKESQSSEKIKVLWEGTDYKDIPEIMNANFGAEAWKEISKKCIGCGACTFVCPTCYCFDIRDEKDNQQGKRYRCWDFCTSYLYTLEASGHNPRAELNQRYRNKINCKYNYNYRRHGHLYCVGCGRCIDVCPVNMDIREIVGTIVKEK